MPRRRPVPADHAARLFAFVRAYRCVHLGEYAPEHAATVQALLERPGHYIALHLGTPEDRSPVTAVVVLASRPLDGIMGYLTVTINEAVRRVGDLLRSSRVAKVELGGGVLRSEIERCRH